MKCKFAASILAFLLAFQLSPAAYAFADTLEEPEDNLVAEDILEPAPTDEALPGEVAVDGRGSASDDVSGGDGGDAIIPVVSTIQDAPQLITPFADTVSVDFKITGLKIDAGFVVEDEWASETLLLDEATDAITATIAFLEDNASAFSYIAYGTFLDSISFGGVTLAGGSSGSDYSYWEFWLNGWSYWGDPATLTPEPGDTWEWRYNDSAEVAFASQAFEIKITGVDNIGGISVYSSWLAATKYYDLSIDVLAATCAVLDRSPLSYALAGAPPFAYLDSITKDGATLATSVAPPWNWWEFIVNGASSWDAASDVYPQPGDVFEFKYVMTGEDAPVEVILVPDAPRPDYLSDNAGYTTHRVVSSETPQAADSTQLSFKSFLKDASDWETSFSDILLVNNNIYVAIGQSLVIFDGASGEKLKETQLVNSIGYTCRPLYTHGLIIVPLNGGILQAFTADELICVWVTEALPSTANGSHQNSSSLIEKDGYLYYGTAVADWITSYAGTLLCIDALTGALVWKNENLSSGYYWAGGVIVGEYIYIADDSGNLTSYHATQGWWTWESCELGVKVRSTLASDGNYLYAADYDGTLWRIALGDWGAVATAGSLSFAAKSTSTPVICDGKLFIGGMAADYSGILAVIDLASFTLEQSIDVPAEVQCAPLVVKQGADTYVYFTYNDMPGGMHCFRVGSTAAREIFTPTGDDANWCMSSVVASSGGYLYYTNDSGQLFALCVGADTTTDPGDSSGDDTPGGSGASDGSGGTSGSGGTQTTGGGTVVVVNVDATTGAGLAGTTRTQGADNTNANNGSSNTGGAITGGDTSSLNSDQTPLASGSPEPRPADSYGAFSSLPLIPIIGIVVAVGGLFYALIWFASSRRNRGTKEV